MKKIISAIIFTFLVFNFSNAQNTSVGINTETPLSTVDVAADDSKNPSNTTGVIFPRVTSLNTTDAKEQGLLVFYDTPDYDTRGFYYWDGTTWQPFLSISRIGKDTSVTIATLGTVFADGTPFIQGYTTPVVNEKTIKFAAVATNDTTTPSTVDSNGNLVINKTGYYFISGSSFLKKTGSSATNFRDIYKVSLYVNGVAASVNNPANIDIEGYNSFPIKTDVVILLSGSGVYKLNAGDYVSMKIFRTYADVSTPANTNTETVGPDTTSPSRMTLRYMGNW